MDASTDAKKQAAKLTAEIFSLTGQKVEIDDPLVAAAMVNASIIRQAGADAAKAIAQAAATATPRPSKSETSKPQETTWKLRFYHAGMTAVIASVVAAGICWTALKPSAEQQQAIAANRVMLRDAEIGSGIVHAWQQMDQPTRQAMWNAMDPQTRAAITAALGH